jgi:ATP-dependent DNA ligase
MLPMLAKRIDELPAGHTWIFEQPKWDGFRALIFRHRDEILIQSRDAKSLNRYFPELLEPLNAQLPARCVLDGALQNLGFGKQQLIPARFSPSRIEPVPFGKR